MRSVCVSLSAFFILIVSVVLLASAPGLHCDICVFCLLVILGRFSVSVQVIDWKDSSPK